MTKTVAAASILMEMTDGNHSSAFESVLTKAAYSSAWRYCCRLCPIREDAEDLLQDALTRAISAVASLRNRDSIRAWLMSIIRTTHLMRIRTGGRRPQVAPDYPDTSIVAAEEPLRAEVFSSLSQLKPAERELLTLFYVEGLELAEVAQVTGRSYGAVRQGMLRARRSLRQRMLADAAAGQGTLHSTTETSHYERK